MAIKWLIDASYFVAAILFILGLKGMSSPVSARKGIVWAGVGMVLATVVTFLTPGMGNMLLMVIAIGLGGVLAWVSGKRVAMTDMPQMVAIYNGMGGGAAAAIAAVEFARGEMHGTVVTLLATLGALIGAVSFSGSVVAWAKLQGVMNKAFRLPAQNAVNVVLALVTVGFGAAIVIAPQVDPMLVGAFFVLALVLGAVITLPIGGADMPVVISLFNAFTGLAVGFEGFVMGIPALIIAGIVVGAAGTLLTQLMAKAMNRPISNILFVPMAAGGGGEAVGGEEKEVGAMAAAA
ncbi:NAD(P)(+) transhydrogenase (Re/Si-specific) subunit beta, partial [Zoogloea ramigera]|uniref:NAD(P)(+) transhydrogenase (Re/Si-specific) subunit beta n=1 Tax=Zoogloea ramigera TaxID=350 RepID=UPI003FA1E25B